MVGPCTVVGNFDLAHGPLVFHHSVNGQNSVRARATLFPLSSGKTSNSHSKKCKCKKQLADNLAYLHVPGYICNKYCSASALYDI